MAISVVLRAYRGPEVSARKDRRQDGELELKAVAKDPHTQR